MSDMVERVARAIAEASTQDNWTTAAARAAIEAMREPTDAMKVAGGRKMEAMLFEGDPDYTGDVFEDIVTVHRRMIDEAAAQK